MFDEYLHGMMLMSLSLDCYQNFLLKYERNFKQESEISNKEKVFIIYNKLML